MSLGGFVVAQLALDVILVGAIIVLLVRRASAPPPPWHAEMVALANDVLTASTPMLDALEQTPTTPADRHREARALLRAGASADDVACQLGLNALEIRLLTAIAAAPDTQAV